MNLVCLELRKLVKQNMRFNTRCYNKYVKKPPWSVLFFGADEFSVFSLKALSREYRKATLINRLEVVTTIKGKPNAVRSYSNKENLQLHQWPVDVPVGTFDVGLVVSFGHLIPEKIIEKFPFGILNVHASLLPRWRGAAPIIYALANGDSETGITIMRIEPQKFDVGAIVLQASLPILPNMQMPQLYNALGNLGAQHLVAALEDLPTKLEKAKPQPCDGVTYAPKVSPTFACINWKSMTSGQIINLERALVSVYSLTTTWKGINVKLINLAETEDSSTNDLKFEPGFVEYDKQKKVLRVLCVDGRFISVKQVGILGKKVMTAQDFNNGYVKKELQDCRYFK